MGPQPRAPGTAGHHQPGEAWSAPSAGVSRAGWHVVEENPPANEGGARGRGVSLWVVKISW